MMDMNTLCGYPGNRDEVLVSYLYDAVNPIERASFEAHLGTCEQCRTELADLRGVRTQLDHWSPPEPGRAFAQEPPREASRPSVWTRLGQIPVWAQVAAALLVFGVAAGAANIEVQYGRDGLTVRTGWLTTRPASFANPANLVNPVSPANPVNLSSPADPAEPASAARPWRADLVALEQQLRRELQVEVARAASTRTGGAARGGDTEMIHRVQALIEAS